MGSTVALDVRLTAHRGATLAHATGVLDVATYAQLRDTLLKAATEAPRAVIVDVGRLDMPSQASLSVFSVVSLRVAEWPGVPVMLLAPDPARYERLAGSPVARYVPVFHDLDSAMAAIGAPSRRRQDRIRLAGGASSSAVARAFARSTCQRWGLHAVCEDAMAVATELTENVVRHAGGEAMLRMDLRRGLLSLAVSDGSPRQAVLREAARFGRPSAGLSIVARLSRAWGCTPTTDGKVVWAVLRVG